jgi:5-methylcytosine-specific restriction endonuclease McrA
MRHTKEQKAQIAKRRHQRRYRYDMFGNVTAIVYFCNDCGRVRSLDDLEVDHIIPVSLGGSDTLDNKQLLCSTCNRKKGNAIKIKNKLVRIKPRMVEKKGSTSKKKSTTTKRKTRTTRRKSSTAKKKASTVRRKETAARPR